MLERLLIVGVGSIGRRHARLARELLPGLKIAALRHAGCHELDEPCIDVCATSVAEALEFRPQAAVIANPASHHLEVAMELARAGVHLLVEKPISNGTAGLSELIANCHSRGLTLMTGYNLRFLASLRRFRELVQERRVGRVLSVRVEVGQYLPSWRPGADYRDSVSAKAALGGGVLLELSHEIDYLRWLFGEVRWVSAIQRRQSGLEIDVEDTVHMVLGFGAEDGQPEVVAALNMDFIRHDISRCCTVIGENGTLRWNAVAGIIEVFEQGESAWRPLHSYPQQRDESYLAEWRHFLQCIASSGTPLISGSDGLAVLRIVEAARLSSSTGAIARIAVEDDGAARLG